MKTQELLKLSWTTQQRRPNDLLPLSINPRKITEEKRQKLIESLDKFNLVEIPAINEDGTIIAGHQRITTLQIVGRGNEMIDVRVPNRLLTDMEVKEYNLLSNTHSGEFDFEILDTFFADVNMEELGVEITPPEEILMQEEDVVINEADDIEDPDEYASKVKTDIVPGDIFQIGEHRLLCGDSTQTDSYSKLMGEELADLVVTDPPYNVDYTGKTKDSLKISNDSMGQSEFYKFLYDFYTALGAFTKPGGGWYIFHADSEGHNFRQAFIDSGAKLAQCLVWIKNCMVMGRQDYHWQHEPILYGWKQPGSHNWYSDRKQTTVLRFDRPMVSKEHPTMKPIPLVSYLIGNSSEKGQIVADGFGGSGTTMVSCQQTGRKARLIELDPVYCQVIIDRMKRLFPEIEVKKI